MDKQFWVWGYRNALTLGRGRRQQPWSVVPTVPFPSSIVVGAHSLAQDHNPDSCFRYFISALDFAMPRRWSNAWFSIRAEASQAVVAAPYRLEARIVLLVLLHQELLDKSRFNELAVNERKRYEFYRRFKTSY